MNEYSLAKVQDIISESCKKITKNHSWECLKRPMLMPCMRDGNALHYIEKGIRTGCGRH